MPPISHRFMANIDAAFVEQIFHIAKRQRKPDIEHHRQADNLAARFEIAKWVMFGHPTTLRNHSTHLKLVCSDSTFEGAYKGKYF